MKEQKTIEVTLCDFCRTEGKVFSCIRCRKDGCENHAKTYNVSLDRPVARDDGLDVFAVCQIRFNKLPDFGGVFCVDCQNDFEATLRTLGLTQFRLVPGAWSDSQMPT